MGSKPSFLAGRLLPRSSNRRDGGSAGHGCVAGDRCMRAVTEHPIFASNEARPSHEIRSYPFELRQLKSLATRLTPASGKPKMSVDRGGTRPNLSPPF